MSGSRVRWWARRLTIGSECVLPRRFLGPPVASPASGFPGRKRSERAVAGGPLRRLQGANARDSPSRRAPEPGGANTRRVTLAGCAEVPPWRKRLGLTFCAAVRKASGASALGHPFRKTVGTGLGASASVQTGPRRKRLGPGQPRRKRLGFRSAGDRLPGGRSLSFVGPVRACWPRRKRLGQSWFASRVRGRGANASTFLRCATVVRRTGRKRPVFRSTAGAPDFLRNANAPFSIRGTDAPGASGAQAPRFSPAAAPGFSRREASSSWRRPSGWTVGTGAAVAPAVSGGSP